MKAIKFMITGGLLILLGPLMSLVDFSFSPLLVIFWLIGVPLFIIGLVMPEKGFASPGQLEDLPQKKCPGCGRMHDFDYPKCPYCGHESDPTA